MHRAEPSLPQGASGSADNLARALAPAFGDDCLRPRPGKAADMPKPPLPSELDAFLRRPNPSVIGSLQADGAPHTAATWYLWQDGRVEVNMAASRKRLNHLRNDPRVSLTVTDAEDWYRHVTLRGRVVALADDTDLQGIDRLSRHYTSAPYSRRDEPRVQAVIEIDWWHAWVHGRPWRPSGD
jgi:PPOX class probable F420-dependent enzyme